MKYFHPSICAEHRPLGRSVLFLDQNQWCNEPHEWIREYFRGAGYDLIEPPPVPWMDPAFGWAFREESTESDVQMDVKAVMRPTVMRAKAVCGRGESVEELTRMLLPHVLGYWRSVKRVMCRRRPQFLVVLGGYWAEARLATLMARQIGTRVLALENSHLRELFILEECTGLCGNRHSLASWRWDLVRERTLTEPMQRRLRDFLQNRVEGFSRRGDITQPDPLEPRETYRKLDLPPDAKVALVFGQVHYDSVVAADFGSYDSLQEFLVQAVESFEPLKDWHVVVRCHPKEAREAGDVTAKGLRERRFSHDRLRIVSGQDLNTYSIMDIAKFGIAGNSQAGLEMLAHGKPVIVCGHCFYGRKGFTVDVGEKELLPAAVRLTAERPVLSESQRTARDRFLYTLIFEFLCPRNKEEVHRRLRAVRAGMPSPSWLSTVCLPLRRLARVVPWSLRRRVADCIISRKRWMGAR